MPYAVSLSLSVAYREMRHNRVPMYRTRAQVDLKTNCRVLEKLGKIFWAASVTAEMGKSTLKEIDKVYSSVTERENQSSVHRPPTTEITANYPCLSLSRPSEGLYAPLVKNFTCAHTSTVFVLTIW